jgi:membrane dipeptidase
LSCAPTRYREVVLTSSKLGALDDAEFPLTISELQKSPFERSVDESSCRCDCFLVIHFYIRPLFQPSLKQTRAVHRQNKSLLEINNCGTRSCHHRKAIVIDSHNDITTPMTNDDYDLGGPPPVPYRTSLDRMKEGGLTAEFFSVYIKPDYVTKGGAARRTLDMIDSVYRAVERHPNDLMFATSVADIRGAKKQGKIAALMGIEGGHAIEDSLPTLREFYRLGVRYMTLTWNNTNNWADAGRGEKKHNGLSDFGKEVVLEMNRLGMMVDVSHVSDKTMSDALDVSKAPISHRILRPERLVTFRETFPTIC